MRSSLLGIDISLPACCAGENCGPTADELTANVSRCRPGQYSGTQGSPISRNKHGGVYLVAHQLQQGGQWRPQRPLDGLQRRMVSAADRWLASAADCRLAFLWLFAALARVFANENVHFAGQLLQQSLRGPRLPALYEKAQAPE